MLSFVGEKGSFFLKKIGSCFICKVFDTLFIVFFFLILFRHFLMAIKDSNKVFIFDKIKKGKFMAHSWKETLGVYHHMIG